MIKTEPMNKNGLFRKLYARGKSAAVGPVVLYAMKGRGRKNWLGITVSTKIGGAVVRNRARRLIREGYRQLEEQVRDGFLIVVVARSGIRGKKMQEVRDAMETALKRTGALDFREEPARE